MTQDFSHSAVTTLPFEDTVDFLKQSLQREGFRIVAEIEFHRELKRHVGLRWKNYTVLVVWSPFLAYQGLLSDRNAGTFMPFNFVVADNGESTLVAATNHLLFGRLAGTIGVQILTRDLSRKISGIMSEIAEQGNPADELAAQEQGKEAS
jgi:uncharacterized protein (DUF302 family)